MIGKLVVVHTFANVYRRKTETDVRYMIKLLKRADYDKHGNRRTESTFERMGDDLVMTVREPVSRGTKRRIA